MADLSITEANVGIDGAETRIEVVTVGATVGRGEPLYFHEATEKYLPAINTSAAAAEAAGITLSGASADGTVAIVVYGPMIIGAAVTAGAAYVVSDTAGGIAPNADLGSGDYVRELGRAISSTVLFVDPSGSGVQHG